ncbi:hypothetical protein HMPREF0497_2275 [Lentilactobacillus buchneri ATCC 11577]|uniref:Uncharacterized protein n=1 Tax=Lentilactobacillus hilgardii (strain ATCC 8290 / DSM 20176 / CCUG 30140 / JCM 1155 / KCTC 3500 / NBRC 15886 / NCIMB 8040 / NRRL B-1843 / 9) TaxID=1423757 RepID=C0XLG6_LENH9|nr:hypothetical protein HMPREF0497_2275 [Lentilactobacillus buchneri ATCC 11577]EEI23911.1 hypothetical protein HMPREF0519_2077 [Lentilactobacillus hilgardii DSM 20176 = ATCC 8290]
MNNDEGWDQNDFVPSLHYFRYNSGKRLSSGVIMVKVTIASERRMLNAIFYGRHSFFS